MPLTALFGRSEMSSFVCKLAMSRRAAWPAVIVFSLLIPSCIPVYDLSEYWDKGAIDPRLEGDWIMTDPIFDSQEHISFKRDGKSCWCIWGAAPAGLPAHRNEVRTLAIGKHKFLMIRLETPIPPGSAPAGSTPADRAQRPIPGALVRYSFERGQLVFYTLEKNVLSEAIKAGTVRGDRLDKATIEAISRWADDPSKWQVKGKCSRIESPTKPVAAPQSRPATSPSAASTTVAPCSKPTG